MKKRTTGVFLLFVFFCMGVKADPVTLETARKTAEKFYSVQLKQTASKSFPALTCVYPMESKSTGFVPYYIFNAEQNQGFVIVAGDDNAPDIVLGYSDKGSFEMKDMPGNLKFWLDFYAENIRLAAGTGVRRGEETKGSFAKAEVVKEPLLGEISYNQDAPYNALCPIDPTTNKRSYTGCVATALASIARYYEFPKQGQGSITYTTPKGSTLTMDFSQNTYDWANTLETYKGSLSQYTEEQITAIATIMRDMGYAVQMGYGSDASGAIRPNTISGMVTYMGFDSIVSYRERNDYDNDAQWISLLKDNIDNGQPIYYTGQGDGGGHAFIFDGYDDADFFHVNWGWGGWCDGYFSIRSVDPQDITGPGAGSGGGYTRMQGILHNLVPRGHSHCADEFLLIADNIETDLQEDSLYDIRETLLEVPFGGIKNQAMQPFKGTVALAAFRDGELVQVLSDEKNMEIDPQGSQYSVFSLAANLEKLEDGVYEIWAVCKPAGENMSWQKIYAKKNNKYTNDSYIPVKVGSGHYELQKTMATLTVNVECIVRQYISMYIYSDGELLGRGQALPGKTERFKFKYGEYDLRFWVSGFDTSYVSLNFTKDTAINIIMQEKYLKPRIWGISVDGNTATLLWDKDLPNGELAFPEGFVIYLDSVEVARVDAEHTEYVYTNVPVGRHWAGLSSVYKTGESEMAIRSFTITTQSSANEKAWEGICRISPNPSTNGVFVLEVDRDCRLQVCSLAGNVLLERNFTAGSHQVDMGGYSAGVYLFRLSGGNGESALLKAVLR